MECGKRLLLSFTPVLHQGREDAQIVVRRTVRGIDQKKVLPSHARLRVVFLLTINLCQHPRYYFF